MPARWEALRYSVRSSMPPLSVRDYYRTLSRWLRCPLWTRDCGAQVQRQRTQCRLHQDRLRPLEVGLLLPCRRHKVHFRVLNVVQQCRQECTLPLVECVHRQSLIQRCGYNRRYHSLPRVDPSLRLWWRPRLRCPMHRFLKRSASGWAPTGLTRGRQSHSTA